MQVVQVWDKITKPHIKPESYQVELKTRLASFMLVSVAINWSFMLFFIKDPPLYNNLSAWMAVMGTWIIYYFFARRGNFMIVSLWLVLVTAIAGLLRVFFNSRNPGYTELMVIRDMYSIFLVIVSAQYIATKLLAFVVGCVIVGLFSFPCLLHRIEFSEYYFWVAVVALVGIFHISGSLFLDIYYTVVEKQLISNISHELRTPLHSIIGAAKLLDNCEKETRRELLETIVHSAKDMLMMVNDLLDFSNLQSGDLKIFNAQFNLPIFLKNIVKSIKHMANAKKLELTLDTPDNLPEFVFGDSLRIKQILLNLLSNAIKFTDKGSVSLRVIVSNVKNQVADFIFIVNDTGRGISKSDLDKVFHRYAQFDPSTPGTGLGLAICKDLSKLMGATVSAVSTVGKGSSFMFQIKLKISESTVPQKNTNLEQPQQFNKKYTFLLAEDNRLIQLLTRNMLKSFGAQVDIVENGKLCLEKYLSNPQLYSAILMDIQMPVMDGHTAAKLIRDEEQTRGWKHIPIIGVSANVTNHNIRLCKLHGMSEFIPKPFKKKQLFATLNKFLTEN